jgi:hypothetical protein
MLAVFRMDGLPSDKKYSGDYHAGDDADADVEDPKDDANDATCHTATSPRSSALLSPLSLPPLPLSLPLIPRSSCTTTLDSGVIHYCIRTHRDLEVRSFVCDATGLSVCQRVTVQSSTMAAMTHSNLCSSEPLTFGGPILTGWGAAAGITISAICNLHPRIHHPPSTNIPHQHVKAMI